MSRKDMIRQLIDEQGGRFSSELGIDLDSGSSEEIFKWFLASILFGTRISRNLAVRTYLEFANRNVLTPDAILRTGWEGLVEILDEGGYARYDFKTATKLLEISQMLIEQYGGDLNRLHEEARDPRHLESRLMEMKGVGPVTVNIFLRELRGIWKKAQPMLGDLAIEAARNLGFTRLAGKDDVERKKILHQLEELWEQAGLPYRFSDFETALVRFGIESRWTNRKTKPKAE